MKNTITPPRSEFDHVYAAEQLRRSRHQLRRFIKGFYLRHILADVKGPSIDFGCGAGQLLERLPPGSVGLEVNPHLIESLRNSGQTVRQACADIQDFELNGFDRDIFKTLVIAHVLEHMPDPAAALGVLLAACQRIGIERIIVVVPGAKGYLLDRTHKTFINRAYVESCLPLHSDGFIRSRLSYFPGPWEWIGRYFVFHEMKLVFDRVAEAH